MQDIEPYYRWRDLYIADEDELSPFYGREYSEFEYTNTIYNYYIHPQWDDFGSSTLYLKVLFVDYEIGYAIIEMIGEWNDAINNDIMTVNQEWFDDTEEGWIVALNFREYVKEEFNKYSIDYYLVYGGELDEMLWRTHSPSELYQKIQGIINHRLG